MLQGMTLMILLMVSWPTIAVENSANRTLTFEVAVNSESELHKSLATAFREILHKLGYELKTISLPPKRGLQELKAGRVDGSVGRIGNLAKLLQSDDVIRLDSPVAIFQISRWCRKDLDKTSRTIKLGTRLGTLVLMMLKEHMDLSRVQLEEIGHQKAIIQMLKSSRLDCFLSSDQLLENDGIKRPDLQNFDRFDFVSFEVYPWIQRRHAGLKERLESELKSYPFSKDFRQKYMEHKPACDGKLNVLCPDGLIIKAKVDMS
jgi:hypothetical protein